jgi:hypothetical protein
MKVKIAKQSRMLTSRRYNAEHEPRVELDRVGSGSCLPSDCTCRVGLGDEEKGWQKQKRPTLEFSEGTKRFLSLATSALWSKRCA